MSEHHEGTARTYDDGKPRLQDLPWDALLEVGKVAEMGARKYAPRNWQGGMPASKNMGCVLRHIARYMAGEYIDEESGLPALSHAAMRLLFQIWYDMHMPHLNDIVPGLREEGEVEVRPEIVPTTLLDLPFATLLKPDMLRTMLDDEGLVLVRAGDREPVRLASPPITNSYSPTTGAYDVTVWVINTNDERILVPAEDILIVRKIVLEKGDQDDDNS